MIFELPDRSFLGGFFYIARQGNVTMTKQIVHDTDAETTYYKQVCVQNADNTLYTLAKIIVQNQIKHTPKVSVIIPVYNVAAYLPQCLDSVINQTLKDIEIICIDDGSTDVSLTILKEYAQKDKRITILHQQNLYAGVARNAGMSVARGKYLSFLDSDDFFEPTMLQEMFDCANKYDLDICVCNADIYNDKNQKFYPTTWMLRPNVIAQRGDVFNAQKLGHDIYYFTNPAAWNKLYRHKFIKQNHLYFQNLQTCNDIGMGWAALSLAQRIAAIDKVFVHYRSGSDVQISSNRGHGAINIIHAYYYIKNFLLQNNLYKFIPFLNTSIQANILSELSHCSHTDRKHFYKLAKIIMKRDFKIFKACFTKDRINRIKHYFFYKKRHGNNKRRIYICGIHVLSYNKHKIKRIFKYPIHVYEKHLRLKDKVKQLNGK